MRFMQLGAKTHEKPCLLDEQSIIRDISSIINELGPRTLSDDLITTLGSIDVSSLPIVDPKGLRITSPIMRPRTIFCIGLNYSDHAKEAGMAVPEEPILFSKASAAFSGPYDDILYGPNTSKLDWEAELGIVIGKDALHVSKDKALDHVFGYTLVNDISERAWQIERGGQWIKGKSFPSFCPTGPILVTKDEINDVTDLNIWLDVNGERQQTGNTRHMIFSIETIVSYLSQFTLLEAGDLICTGTPPGVGMGKDPQKWLEIGDVVTLGCDALGEQRQTVVKL